MKPGIDQHLIALTGVLATKIAPALPEGHYATGDAGMVAAMLVMLAQEVDRRADTLWRENKVMRLLFADASQLILPAALDSQVQDAARTQDESLRISALEANHAALSETLIALHAVVEADKSDAACAINARIWDLLEQAAHDRMLVMPVS